MNFSPFFAIGFALFGLAGSVGAEISPSELRTILGNHDGVDWAVEQPENWSVVEGRLVLSSSGRDTIHYLEAALNGPGVMELRPSNFLNSKFEGAILVDGMQSGGKAHAFNHRIQVGEGSHVVRWQLKNVAAPDAQPAVAALNPVIWEEFSEVPLQSAGVSGGAVTLTGDWLGQDRVHRGDGSSAWSGIQVFGLPLEPLVEPVMRADFSGAGVFSYHYKAGGAAGKVRHDGGLWEAMVSAGGWHKVVKRVSDGDHVIEWKAASGNSEYRRDRDLLIDDIRFSPEVLLADSLDTPEWSWMGIDGGQGRPFGAEEPAAKGGATVILPNGSSISTHLPGEGIVRIRFKGHKPGVAVGSEQVAMKILANDPEVAGSDHEIAVVLIPPGGGLLQISTHWQIEVDSVEWISPPPSIAATLDLPDTITSGGTGNWAPAPLHRLGKYVAALTLNETSPEGWFEFPVTGPAEVTVAYEGHISWPAIEFMVDGRRVWGSGIGYFNSRTATIEIPTGTHVLRCLGRKVSSYEMNLQITALAVTPLAAEGKLGAAMDHPTAWASSGEWELSGELTHDGGDALRPVPPPNPPYPSYPSEHVVQTPVSGPGYVSFMTYVMDSPETSYSAPIHWGSDVHPTVFRRFNDEQQGWMRHRVWYPPGEHSIRWGVSGTAHDLSLVAIDEMAFEASETLTFDAVVGNADEIWENDPDRPWSGVRKEAGGDAFIISPIGPAEPTRISMKVQGPGDIAFHWRNSAKGNTEGELWIDGVKTSQKLPWSEEGETVTVAVPQDGTVTLEWRFDPRFAGNWVAMKDVVWTPWPEVSLGEALDAPGQVAWETPAALPFKGRPDSGAKNGSAAQVGLMPGEETWLEATVTGPGLFDFWLRGVPGSLNDPRDVEWELFIDGVKSHINTYNSTWPAQWVLGAGVHKIRLVFRNGTEGEGPAFIAMDDVSWEPLVPAPGGAGWTASHPELVDGFAAGGFSDGPQHVVPVATGEVRWIEKTVTGPGVLEWSTRLTKGGYPIFNRQVLINGICALPLNSMSGWETNRLHIPEGVHTVRWTCEPGSDPGDEPYPVQADAIWQISNVVFTPGVSPLMQGIDDEEMFWLAVGSTEGSLVSGKGAHDGEEAWSLGDETVLYLCNTTTQGIKARGMVFRRDIGSDEPAWAAISRWAGPGESVEWVRAKSDGAITYQPPCFVDDFTMRKIDVISFGEAVDADQEIAVNGWIGLAEADEAFDGIDAAWSFLTRRYGSSTASMTLQGPAKMRFRWKSSGTGALGLRVNGAWFPVAVPRVDWQEVEFEVYEPALIEWVHAGTPETDYEAAGEAWLDSITIQSRPPRTIDAVAGEGSGLVFESTGGAADADPWRAAAYRDATEAWREAARGITGATGLQTTVTGPVLLSFRTYCAGVNIPPPAANAPGAQSVIRRTRDIGFITTRRFLSVRVGDSEKLQIIPEDGDGWTDHLIRVPAGEHRVVWQLGGTVGLGSSSEEMQEWQAWVGDVTLRSPRAHYDSWTDDFLGGGDAREPGEDSDGDGVINFLEYAYGSDPADGSSKPVEMFGVVQPASGINGLPSQQFALHVPRLPAHVTAVLQTSPDLVTWTPSPIPLRSFLSAGPDLFLRNRRDYDSGIHQVILFDIIPEQPANFFRIELELPGNGG